MVGVDEFEIGEFRGAEIDALHEDLVGIYRVCYSGPPWSETEADVAAYAERIREWAERDGFAGLVARYPDGALAGVTYGWSGPAEIGGTPLPGVGAERPFHVGDLMVDPSARHRGLGRTLLQRLVTNRIPAVLITHPTPRPAGSTRTPAGVVSARSHHLTPRSGWSTCSTPPARGDADESPGVEVVRWGGRGAGRRSTGR